MVPSGTVFGNLTVIEFSKEKQKYFCECFCGKSLHVRVRYLRDGSISSCGCIKKVKRDHRRFKLEGTKIGYWKVLTWEKDKKKYKVECVCGTVKLKPRLGLLEKNSRSCGCKSLDLRFKTKIEESTLEDRMISRYAAIYNGYESSAKRKELLFEISLEYFMILAQQNCEYCGHSPRAFLFTNKTQRLYGTDYTKYNGVDRVDNTIGYTKNNCVPCCKICNYAKRNMAHEDWNEWLKDIINFNYPINSH